MTGARVAIVISLLDDLPTRVGYQDEGEGRRVGVLVEFVKKLMDGIDFVACLLEPCEGVVAPFTQLNGECPA